jgi:bifunctional non-homologous end joining protein LigD
VANAILDGEVVCVGPDGRPVFNELLYRRGTPYLYAFDILWLNGHDLRGLALVVRKRRLRRVIPQQPFPVLYTNHEDGHGRGLFEAACSLDQVLWQNGNRAFTWKTSTPPAGIR